MSVNTNNSNNNHQQSTKNQSTVLFKSDIDDIPLLEYVWRRLTRKIVLPTDDREEVARKVACLVFGSFFLFLCAGIYLMSQANNHEAQSKTWYAIFIAGLLCVVWGSLVALPTLLYVIITKTAPSLIASYVLWGTYFLSVSVDILVTFYGTQLVLVTVVVLAINACLPSANYLAFATFVYVLITCVRDAFGYQLRMEGAYEGTPGERFAFLTCSYLAVIGTTFSMNVANWETSKMLGMSNSANLCTAIQQQ